MTSLKKIINQSLHYPQRFIKGRLQKSSTSQDALKPGEGAIVNVNGEKVAAYKKEDGTVINLSPVCTHLGCMWVGIMLKKPGIVLVMVHVIRKKAK